MPCAIWPVSGLHSYLSVSFTLNGFLRWRPSLPLPLHFCAFRCSTHLWYERMMVMAGWVLCYSKCTISDSSLTHVLWKSGNTRSF